MTQNEAMERAKERWNANLLSDDRVRNKIAQREHRKEEAKRLVDKYGGYGGRRILGVDSNGNNIQVSFWATHDSFEIKQSHDDLRRFTFERDGKPAAARMQLFKTATNPKELELLKEPLDERSDAVRSMRRKTGFSTDMTAYWIQAIINEARKFEGKKAPRSIFRECAWAILPGTFDQRIMLPQISWSDAADYMNYTDPEGYIYWTVVNSKGSIYPD